MKLKEYLKRSNIRPAEFADRIEATTYAVHSWIYRGVVPRKKMLKRINECTFGQVTYEDFLC